MVVLYKQLLIYKRLSICCCLCNVELTVDMFAGGDDRFEVDSESGIVRTRGRRLLDNMEYELGVSAQDITANTLQKSPTHSLKVLVGQRDPQFFETQYIANVPESATERYKYVSTWVVL